MYKPELAVPLHEVFFTSAEVRWSSPIKYVVLPIVSFIQGSVDTLEALKFINGWARRDISAFGPCSADCKSQPVAAVFSIAMLTSSFETRLQEKRNPLLSPVVCSNS